MAAQTPHLRAVADTGKADIDPWVERLAWLMDSAFRVGPWSIGLDGVIGLLPGFGDVAGALISMLIVLRAVQTGLPRIAVARMTANVAIDALAGSVPIAGDLFDFAWKANVKNVRIYRECISDPRAGTVRHWAFFAVLGSLVMATLAVPAIVIVLLVRAVWPALGL